MQVFPYCSGGRAIDHFGSRGFTHVRVARVHGGAAVSCVSLEAGGVIGEHPAAGPQLLIVVEGSAYVRGSRGPERPISVGEAVRWDAGETHETRTDSGLVAIVVEADSLDVAATGVER